MKEQDRGSNSKILIYKRISMQEKKDACIF